MKFIIFMVAFFVFFSCNSNDIAGNGKMEETPPLPDSFSLSLRGIQDSFNIYSDIAFGDTLGNIYYSKKSSSGLYKTASQNKALLKISDEDSFIWQASLIFPDVNELVINDYTFSEKSGAIYLTGGCVFDDWSSMSMFVMGIGADGNQMWLQFWGPDKWNVPLAIAVDSKENIYVAGGVAGSFEGEKAGGCDDQHDDTECYDGFISKFNEDGTLLWNKQSGIDMTDIISGLTIDNEDHLYITGADDLPRGYSSNSCISTSKMFLSMWDSDGKEIWKKSDSLNDGLYGIDIDMMGSDIIVLGNDCIDGDSSKAQVYLEKYDRNGNVLWTKEWNGNDEKISSLFAVEVAVVGENIYTILNSWREVRGYSDVMVAFFDKDGVLAFSNRIESPCQDYPRHISVLPDGSVIVTGDSDGLRGADFATAECVTESFKPFIMTLHPSENLR